MKPLHCVCAFDTPTSSLSLPSPTHIPPSSSTFRSKNTHRLCEDFIIQHRKEEEHCVYQQWRRLKTRSLCGPFCYQCCCLLESLQLLATPQNLGLFFLNDHCLFYFKAFQKSLCKISAQLCLFLCFLHLHYIFPTSNFFNG